MGELHVPLLARLPTLDTVRERGYTTDVTNSYTRRNFVIDAVATVCIFVNDQEKAKAFKVTPFGLL